MKTLTRIILAAAFVGTLGLSGLARTVYATQSRPGVMLQPHSSTQIAEASDGDGEENDATEVPEQVKQPHSSINPSSIPIKVQEASDGDREENDATEPEQVKDKKFQSVTNSGSNTQEEVNDAPNSAAAKAIKSFRRTSKDSFLYYSSPKSIERNNHR